MNGQGKNFMKITLKANLFENTKITLFFSFLNAFNF